MSENLTYSTMSVDAIEQFYEQKTNPATEKTKFKEFNFEDFKKNYLDIRLGDKELKRELRIRFLPMENGTPFKEIYTHYVSVPTDVSKSGFKTYICLNKTSDFGKTEYGTECPFCQINQEAYTLMTLATSEFDHKKYYDVMKNNMAQQAYVVRCIERGKEEDGVKFWKFSGSRNGGGIYDDLMELFRTRKAEGAENGENVNIFDLNKGRDFKIIIKKGEAKDSKQTFTIMDVSTPQPLTTDVTLGKSWINDEKRWYNVFSPKPYEFLKLIINGEVPFYNKESKTWVSKEEYRSIKENSLPPSVKAAQDFNDFGGKDSADSKQLTNTEQLMVESTELPY